MSNNEEFGVCLMAYKRRSGVVQYLQQHFWEQRWIVITGNEIAYYKLGKEDGDARGKVDILRDKVEVQVMPKSKDAPTPFMLHIQFTPHQEDDLTANSSHSKGSLGRVLDEPPAQSQWKFCFVTQEDLVQFLGVVNGILERGNAFEQKDANRFEHDFRQADHIYRWEMIVCPPVIYPVQIHGIVLSAGRNCVVVADFGLTGYGRKEGNEFHHSQDDNESENNKIFAAWKKLRPDQQDQRLNILTITDQYELRKWTRANYGEESILGIDDGGSPSSKPISPASSTSSGSSPKSKSKSGKHKSGSLKDMAILFSKGDPDNLVLARANYLLENMDVIPKYHVFYSNSECLAVWCKVGRWATLQTAVWATCTSVGGTKSTVAATIAVAAAHVALAPIVALGGMIYAGAPLVILKKSKGKWEKYTAKMTDLFWQSADPASFVAAIEAWSGLCDDNNAEEDDDEEHLSRIVRTSSTSSANKDDSSDTEVKSGIHRSSSREEGPSSPLAKDNVTVIDTGAVPTLVGETPSSRSPSPPILEIRPPPPLQVPPSPPQDSNDAEAPT